LFGESVASLKEECFIRNGESILSGAKLVTGMRARCATWENKGGRCSRVRTRDALEREATSARLKTQQSRGAMAQYGQLLCVFVGRILVMQQAELRY
jgi:hypothetical protein